MMLCPAPRAEEARGERIASVMVTITDGAARKARPQLDGRRLLEA